MTWSFFVQAEKGLLWRWSSPLSIRRRDSLFSSVIEVVPFVASALGRAKTSFFRVAFNLGP